MKSIGEKLVQLRIANGYTQSELARIIGVSTASIAMYELNQRIPRDEIKKRIASTFKVSVEQIFF